MAIREPIYVALWSLVADALAIRTQFVTTGRFLIPVTELSASQLPALFLLEHGEQWIKTGKGIPAKRTLQCTFVMYVSTPAQAQTYPATQLNDAMDVFDTLMENPGNPQNTQTLGSLVEHVYIEGEVQIIEGQIGDGQQASVLVAPVTILIP